MNVLIFLAALALYLYIGLRFVRKPALARMRTQIREKIELLRVSLADVKKLAGAATANSEITERLTEAEHTFNELAPFTAEVLARLDSEDAFQRINARCNRALTLVNEARRLLPLAPEEGDQDQ